MAWLVIKESCLASVKKFRSLVVFPLAAPGAFP